jgi:hypothetical protein
VSAILSVFDFLDRKLSLADRANATLATLAPLSTLSVRSRDNRSASARELDTAASAVRNLFRLCSSSLDQRFRRFRLDIRLVAMNELFPLALECLTMLIEVDRSSENGRLRPKMSRRGMFWHIFFKRIKIECDFFHFHPNT